MAWVAFQGCVLFGVVVSGCVLGLCFWVVLLGCVLGLCFRVAFLGCFWIVFRAVF